MTIRRSFLAAAATLLLGVPTTLRHLAFVRRRG
jgi:hypothetical protein